MGTIPQLRALINEGITIGLQQFVNEYKPKMEQDAQKSEEKYYNDYSSWADGYRHFDLKNIHTITGLLSVEAQSLGHDLIQAKWLEVMESGDL